MILHGDCLDLLRTLEAESIDACVTDPPYGIGFMGREWDTFKASKAEARIVPNRQIDSDNPNLKGRTRGPASSPSAVEYDYTVKGLRGFQTWTEQWAREVLRVLKPGAYLVVCGAPRSYHRMACGLEDGGFVIRDKFSWLFGSGFPKNYNLGDGKGTALKPGHEPIALAWKPFKGTISNCHQTHGTAALNLDACRLEGNESTERPSGTNQGIYGTDDRQGMIRGSDLGRWPPNVLLDEEAAAMLDEQTGDLPAGVAVQRNGGGQRIGSDRTFSGYDGGLVRPDVGFGGSGGASRFYYVAKPSREERDFGCYALPERSGDEATDRKDGSAGLNNPRAGAGRTGGARNVHPTVKPVELMRWLVKLVTPPDGTVLDPFLGSGTTGMACRYESRQFIGIEREADYIAIAERRIAAVAPLFADEASA